MQTLTVSSFNYSHDMNGNPTAQYSVNAVTVGKRRIQTGYDMHHHIGGAYQAIKRAGYNPEHYKMVSIDGDRSNNYVTSTWELAQ